MRTSLYGCCRARQLPEHVPQKGSVFCEKGCSNKQLERDDNFKIKVIPL